MSDELEIVGDAALEARIVAVVLGEASDFEREEVARLCQEQPELAIFRRRIEAVHGLIGEEKEQQSSASDAWQLAPDRRSAVLAQLSEKEALVETALPQQKLVRPAYFYAAVACAGLALVAWLSVSIFGTAGVKGARSLAYQAESGVLAKPEPELLAMESRSRSPEIAPFASQPESLAERDARSVSVAKKPSAPNSAMSKVIAANTASPAALPVPSLSSSVPSKDFGDGDDFGSGWGGAQVAAADGVITEKEVLEMRADSLALTQEEDPVATRTAADFREQKNSNPAAEFQLRALSATDSSEASPSDEFLTSGNRSGSFEIIGESLDSILQAPEPALGHAWSASAGGGSTQGPSDDPFATDSEEGFGFSANFGQLMNRSAERDSAYDALSLGDSLADEGEVDPDPFASGDPVTGGGKVLRDATDLKLKTKEVVIRQSNTEEQDFAWLMSPSTPSGNQIDAKLVPASPKQSGRGSSLLAASDLKREASSQEAVDLLLRGREAYSGKDYQEAFNQYQEALNRLPEGPKNDTKRAEIKAHLADGAVALAQQFRRVGKYAEAKKLLDDAAALEPQNFVIDKALEYFDDPIRMNPSLTGEHSQEVEEVRRLLSKGEGFYNLADFDSSEKTFRKVLEIDPHNQAARTWLERNSAIKSEYYRAAYDQTHAELLVEVDKAWELEIPTEPSLQEELAQVEAELAKAKSGLSDHRRNGPQTNIFELQKTRDQHKIYTDRLKALKGPHLIRYAAELPVDNNPVREIHLEAQQKERELNQLKASGLGPSHPTLLAKEQELESLGEVLARKVKGLQEALATQQEMVSEQLLAMESRVDDQDGQLLTLATEHQDYHEATREYESSLALLQDLKLKQSIERVALRAPKEPVVLHKAPNTAKKKGFLGMGSYQSEAVLQLNQPPLAQAPPRGESIARALEIGPVKQITSDANLEEAAKSLALAKRWGVSNEAAIARIRKALEVEQKPGTDLIQVRAKSKDPKLAKELAAAVATSFQERRNEEELARVKRQLEALDSEIESQQDKVEQKKKMLDTIVRITGRPYFAGGPQPSAVDPAKVAELEKKRALLRERMAQENTPTQSFALSADVYQELVGPLGAEDDDGPVNLTDALERLGVSFGADSTAHYDGSSGVLIVKNQQTELTLLKKCLERIDKQVEAVKVSEALDEKDAALQGDSTFSLHVSDVSFKLAKEALAQGQWPETVRVEEFVNAFDYGEENLAPGERVGVAMEQAAHPFLPQRNLLRLSLQTAATGRGAGVPLNLTVVLDKSGSMERVDRSRAIEEAFRVLTEQLNPGDKVTMISFSRQPKLLADQLDGGEGEALLRILRETPSEGGTNVEEALQLAQTKALEHFQPEAQNRVILLTDGIANLGNAVPEELMSLVEGMRQQGVAFDACGVGAEGLNDEILEALTRKGDGRYYLLGRTEDSGADFAKQVAGALRPAAQNVKVQIEWNADRVGKWRLYGFEKHELKKEDFRNDSVDAAEMAAEEEGVALYHVEVKPDGQGPLGVARVRFLDVASGEMLEREWEIAYQGEALPLSEADPKIRLAGVAGLAAEKLARSANGGRVEWVSLLNELRPLKRSFPRQQQVQDLERMMEQAMTLKGK